MISPWQRAQAATGMWVALVTGGCVTGPDWDMDLPAADFERFVADVQPVLSEHCANPSCHGTPRRPLEVFAPLQHRRDDTDLYRDVPLTTDELRANFDRSCTFIIGITEPLDCELLASPLAMEQGGTQHQGIIVFESTDEPEYRQLHGWVADTLKATEGNP